MNRCIICFKCSCYICITNWKTIVLQHKTVIVLLSCVKMCLFFSLAHRIDLFYYFFTGMQRLSGNMLLCLLILIGLTSGEYSFYFFIVFLHWLFIWFTILHFLFFCSQCKFCPSNRKDWLWLMWRHSYRYVKMPAVHCISMWVTHLFTSKLIFPSLCFFFFFYTGNFAFKINATDPDNDTLTYQIYGKHSDFFKMDSATGNATLIRPLNKDVRCSGGTIYYICICYAACVRVYMPYCSCEPLLACCIS